MAIYLSSCLFLDLLLELSANIFIAQLKYISAKNRYSEDVNIGINMTGIKTTKNPRIKYSGFILFQK